MNEEKAEIKRSKVRHAKATACTNVAQFFIFIVIFHNQWWTINHLKDLLYTLLNTKAHFDSHLKFK